jgi:hypothetical protein
MDTKESGKNITLTSITSDSHDKTEESTTSHVYNHPPMSTSSDHEKQKPVMNDEFSIGIPEDPEAKDTHSIATKAPSYIASLKMDEAKLTPFYRRLIFYLWCLYALCFIISMIFLILGRQIWYGTAAHHMHFKIALFVFCAISSLIPSRLLVVAIFFTLKRFYSIRRDLFFYLRYTERYFIAFLWILGILISWDIIIQPFYCCGGS